MELPSASAPAAARASTPSTRPSTSTIFRPPLPPSLGSALRSYNADAFLPARSGGGAKAVARGAPVAAKSSSDTQYDGRLVGPDGRTHAPGTPLNQVSPGNGPLIIQVNGINTDLAGQQQEMARLQQQNPNARVVGIHNSTEGFGSDILQSIRDLRGSAGNAATSSLQQTILGELRNGRPVHLVGYSQGALITSRALDGVRNTLIREQSQAVRAANPRMTDRQVQAEATRRAEAQMGNIRVETFGGAAPSYPNGPQYVHYVNRGDPVAMGVGLGPFGTGRGRGAQVHYFNDGIGIPAHGFDRYMNHRVPFEQGRRGDFTRR